MDAKTHSKSNKWKNKGRDETNTSTRQEMPVIASCHQELGKRHKSPLRNRAARENQQCQNFNFQQLLA